MKVIIPGHRYELGYFVNTKMKGQKIDFICTDKINNSPQMCFDGTTNEEVLAVLIDRLWFLNNKESCRENAIAITKLEEALMWLNKRSFDIKNATANK